MQTALLITPDANRKQLQDLAPGPITAVFDAGPTKIGATLKLIELEATKGRFQCLVVSSLRLNVGTRGLLRFLRVLSELEIRVRCVEQPGLVLDQGQALLLRFLDEALSDERRTNIRAGVERARRAGRGPGRPKIVIPERVFALADEGLSLRAIARVTGVGASSIGRALAHRRALQGAGS